MSGQVFDECPVRRTETKEDYMICLSVWVSCHVCEQLPDSVVEAGSNEVVDKVARSTQRFLSAAELRLFHALKEYGRWWGEPSWS
jgi:hypothetical protein